MYSWQESYIAALAEKDPVKLRQLVYETTAAIEQRRLSPTEPDPKELNAIGRAEKALKILTDSLPAPERQIAYWRVVVFYNDGETSGNRVFKDRTKAERWAKRQEKSPVVKKSKIEPFARTTYSPRPKPASK